MFWSFVNLHSEALVTSSGKNLRCTNYISVKREDRTHVCPVYDIKKSDGEPWSVGECGVPFHWYCSQVYSDPEW